MSFALQAERRCSGASAEAELGSFVCSIPSKSSGSTGAPNRPIFTPRSSSSSVEDSPTAGSADGVQAEDLSQLARHVVLAAVVRVAARDATDPPNISAAGKAPAVNVRKQVLAREDALSSAEDGSVPWPWPTEKVDSDDDGDENGESTNAPGMSSSSGPSPSMLEGIAATLYHTFALDGWFSTRQEGSLAVAGAVSKESSRRGRPRNTSVLKTLPTRSLSPIAEENSSDCFTSAGSGSELMFSAKRSRLGSRDLRKTSLLLDRSVTLHEEGNRRKNANAVTQGGDCARASIEGTAYSAPFGSLPKLRLAASLPASMATPMLEGEASSHALSSVRSSVGLMARRSSKTYPGGSPRRRSSTDRPPATTLSERLAQRASSSSGLLRAPPGAAFRPAPGSGSWLTRLFTAVAGDVSNCCCQVHGRRAGRR